MAITAALVTALGGGGKIDYVPITPNARDFTVTLPPGRWLVQIEVSNPITSTRTATLGGVDTIIPASGSHLVTRIVQGGTLTGATDRTGTAANFTHGIAIRLGD